MPQGAPPAACRAVPLVSSPVAPVSTVRWVVRGVAGTVLLVAVALVGLSLATDLRSVGPPPLHARLTNIAQTTTTDSFGLTGVAESESNIVTSIDGHTIDQLYVRRGGTFTATVPLDTPGLHEWGLTAYGPFGDVVGSQTGLVSRLVDPPPAPVILAAEKGSGVLVVEVAVQPYSSVAFVDPGLHVLAGQVPSTADDAGRAKLVQVVPAGTSTMRLASFVDGHTGPATTLDLGSLPYTATASVTSASVRTDQTVVVDAQGLTRTVVVETDPSNPAFRALEARSAVGGFLTRMGVDLGFALWASPATCDPYPTGVWSATRDVTIGTRAVVTLTDSLPVSLDHADMIRFCLPEGSAAFGNSGSFTVRLADSIVATVSPVSDSVTNDASGTSYVWQHLRPRDTVVMTFARAPLAILHELPRLSVAELVREGFGPLLSVSFYLLMALVPLVLLGWAVGRLGRRAPEDPLVGRAVSGTLVLVGVSTALYVLSATGLLQSAVPIWAFAAVSSQLYVHLGAGTAASVDTGAVVVVPLILVGGLSTSLVGRRRRWPAAVAVCAGFLLAGLLLLVIQAISTGWQLVFGSAAETRWLVWGLAVTLSVALAVVGAWGLTRGIGNVSMRRLGGSFLALVVGLCMLLALAIANATSTVPTRAVVFDAPARLYGLAGMLFLPMSLLTAVAALLTIAVHSRGRPWEAIIGATVEGNTAEGASAESATGAAAVRGGLLTARQTPAEWAILWIGAAVFAGWISGSYLLGLPIGFAAGLALFALIHRPLIERHALAAVAIRVRAMRRQLVAIRLSATQDAARTTDADKGGGGSGAAPTVAVGSSLALPFAPVAAATTRPEPDLALLAAEVLALGPHEEAWRDAALAIQLGSWIFVPILAIYMSVFWLGSTRPEDPYVWPTLVLNLVMFGGYWVLLSGFFGLLFESIRGRTGLRKGLILGIALAIATAPAHVVALLDTPSSLPTFVFESLQTVVFTAGLGFLFDYRYLRPAISGTTLRARVLAGAAVSGFRESATVLVAFIAIILLSVQSAIAGQLSGLLTSVLKPFLPH